jgi:hypothetical protein
MIGAGTIINPIIKIVTTVVILGAIYLFFVKPALDTTNNAFDQFGLDGLSETFDDLPTDIQDQVDRALEGTEKSDASRLGTASRGHSRTRRRSSAASTGSRPRSTRPRAWR